MGKEKLGETITLGILICLIAILLKGAVHEKHENERIEAERIAYIQELQEMARMDSHEYIQMLEEECRKYEINSAYIIAHSRIMTDDFTNDYCLKNHNFGTPEYERVFADAEEGIRIYVNWFYLNNEYIWNYNLKRIGKVMGVENYYEKMKEIIND